MEELLCLNRYGWLVVDDVLVCGLGVFLLLLEAFFYYLVKTQMSFYTNSFLCGCFSYPLVIVRHDISGG